ncbi:hypothetical protein O3M35_006180 [Rhynocoris fuscipes]|uniref:Uncharacterized protein n=1 Tax=Rhynocoris fuscipes TaxID=488301 RepID=A0AAW1DD15_9HEMI
MSATLENSYLRLRVRQLVDSYPEPSVLGDCDCTSYSYFLLSIILLTLGVYITVPALGGADHHVFSNLGHMWLVGPLCICCGAMVAIKSVLYLRRKSVIKMLLRQRALLRQTTRVTAPDVGGGNGVSGQVFTTSGSTLTLPPAYDLIVTQTTGEAEHPPPTYDEAMRLVQREKANQSTALVTFFLSVF